MTDVVIFLILFSAYCNVELSRLDCFKFNLNLIKRV